MGNSRIRNMARISWIAPLAVFATLVVYIAGAVSSYWLSVPGKIRLLMLLQDVGTALWLGSPVLALVGLVAGVLALVGIRKVGGRRWPAIVGTAGSSLIVLIAVLVAVASAFVDELRTISLDSAEGQALLQEHNASDYLPLRKNWVAQLPAHCSAASAVIVMNASQPGKHYTQNGLFVPETAHIITQDVVLREGICLDQLADLIHDRSGLETEIYYAGSGEFEYDHSDFVEHLKKNRANPDDQIIVEYSEAYLSGRGTHGGHTSPVADYNEEEDMVLVLEVKPWPAKPFWISSKDIYAAMNTIDTACDKRRGWLVVSK